MKLKRFLLGLSLTLPLIGCSSPTPEAKNKISFPDQEVNVYGEVEIKPIFSIEEEDFNINYDSENIRIEDGKIIGIKVSNSTPVTLTTRSGETCTFNVTVKTKKAYAATGTRDNLKVSGNF